LIKILDSSISILMNINKFKRNLHIYVFAECKREIIVHKNPSQEKDQMIVQVM